MVDHRGEAPRAYAKASAFGFYYHDTRYISTWSTTINGSACIPLANELRFGGNTLVLSMTNRDFSQVDGTERIPRDTFLIRRILSLVEDTVYETLAIRNFDQRSHTLRIEQWAGSQFDDLFEVRGFPRAKRGEVLPPEEHLDRGFRTSVLRYAGLDGILRKTFHQQLFASDRLDLVPGMSGTASRIVIPPKEDVYLRSVVSFDKPSEGKLRGRDFLKMSVAESLEVIASNDHKGIFTGVRIETDNAIVNRGIRNAQTDIHMLLTAEEGGNLYPYAGIPWFSAPFGRDGIITAYQLLPWYPKLAQGVLDYAFRTLGTKIEDFTDEQPGKVFHEMRRGEMSNTREVPFIPYYGSVDSTPLALTLLHEYVSWTMDLERLRAWWPTALRALEWIEKWGDGDGDGFLEYAKQSPTGLVNQGWKDSHDSIMHASGRLAQAPIRLCEVQGYSYRARMGMSELAKLLGHDELSKKLRSDALQLKSLFLEKFWDPTRKFIYLALDGDSEACEVLSSNMGHCLWSGIVGPEQAKDVVKHLMGEAMFSGYGIRTLADTERAYNPLSYHNGSVWPHDNSMIMEGLRRYGHTQELERLALSLIGVLESSDDFRLPELFCGFRKRGSEPPVPYEVACKPQAWAAGSVFLMLKSMLGISMDLDQSHVTFHSPLLTSKIQSMDIQNLRGRDWEMDLHFRRASHGTSIDITRRHGNVRVLTVK